MSRLLFLTACFAGGILLADQAGLPPGAWIGLALVGLPLALLPRAGLAGAAVLAVAAGGCALAFRLEAADDHDVHAELRATLEGTVESAIHTERGVRILLAEVRNAVRSQIGSQLKRMWDFKNENGGLLRDLTFIMWRPR